MIRSKTTMVIGPGAGLEIELPDKRELLVRMAAAFDFSRLGSDLQTREMAQLARHFGNLADRLGTTDALLLEAAQRLRTVANVSGTVDAALEQLSDDPLAMAAGKLALVFFILQAESRSPLMLAPREAGDLPLRGSENWLFQLGRMITSGVPRGRAETCFDNLTIINFSYDRSIQHYLPWVVSMAFAMSMEEARELVAARLNITHPLGRIGRLPWEQGDRPAADWGSEDPGNLPDLLNEVQTSGERRRDQQYVTDLEVELATSDRILFLGFDFDPQAVDFLFDGIYCHDPDVIAVVQGMNEANMKAALRLLRRRTGIEDDGRLSVLDMRCFQFMRDYALFLES